MKDALHFILSSIIEDEKALVIEQDETDGIMTFQIRVAKEDIGKVIGKEGKIIRAIRNVMKIPAIKQNKKIQISVSE